MIIEATNLCKHYSRVRAVDGLNLEVRAGEVFGLLGPNGAGKSTTLEMLEGITPPDSGRIQVLGLDWRYHARAIRSRIGVQFQSTSLFDKITPREALELYGGCYPRRLPAGELLKLVQLTDKADVLQETLSGGQWQRLALGLALVNDPELVFLDEPTTGLDPQARQGLWDLVRRIKAEGRTVILTTHYLEEAEVLCDRLAILDHGRILKEGTPLSLIQEFDLPSVVQLTFQGAAPDPGPFSERIRQPITVQAETWEVPIRDVKTLLPPLMAAAETAGVPYLQLQVRRATLEEVFLHLTGRSLRD